MEVYLRIPYTIYGNESVNLYIVGFNFNKPYYVALCYLLNHTAQVRSHSDALFSEQWILMVWIKCLTG
jgi:hypothetical protein